MCRSGLRDPPRPPAGSNAAALTGEYGHFQMKNSSTAGCRLITVKPQRRERSSACGGSTVPVWCLQTLVEGWGWGV